MNLLLDEIDVLDTAGDPSSVVVRGVAFDSRMVEPGDLFFCLPGTVTDGRIHAPEALARGAVGVVSEEPLPELAGSPAVRVLVSRGRARPSMARVAAAFWGHPSRELVVGGVTGTNGKTTVAHLLGAALEAGGHRTTVIGTLTGSRTTPEAPDLQRLLAAARAHGGAGGGAVAMEVSSHALAQSRVDGIHFDVAVFTNLSHEHLDYHGTMEEYFSVKASLFTPERAVRGVVDAEDPWGRRLLAAARIPMVAVRRGDATAVELAPGRSSFTWRGRRVSLALTGAVNVRNAVLAAEAAVALGLSPEEVAAGLAAAPPVPGRLETVVAAGPTGPPFTVLVDYAHTPAGLDVALGEARRLVGPGGRVIVVFGCGGDRDRSKRPAMGAAARRGADLVVVTSDNPRSEDPGAIIQEVLAGMPERAPDGGGAVVEPDRREAVGRAVRAARPGDVVLIAGKGHERAQIVGDRAYPFDDREVAAEAVARVGAGEPGASAVLPENGD